MNLFSFSTSLGWSEKEVLPRLRALELTDPCRRCAGRGFVGIERTADSVCFKCRGAGDELPKLTRVLCKAVAHRVVNGDLRSYLERQRRRFEAARELPLAVARCRRLISSGDLESARELSEILRSIEARAMDPETGLVLLETLHARLSRTRDPVSCQALGDTK